MYYSVTKGRQIGVFLTWALASPAVLEYPGAVVRKWKILQDAVKHLKTCGIDNIDVHTPEGTVPLATYCEQRPTSDVFYSIANGRKPGVFLNWSQCHSSITDYPGAIYRKWKTLEEATQHLNRHGLANCEIDIHTSAGTMLLHEYCEQNVICLPTEVDYEPQTLFDLRNG